jgi:hypothetical protein
MRLHDVRARWKIDREALIARAIMGFLALGIVLRIARYLQNFPLWCDETMLAVNLLSRRWAELAQPLDYHQVCPLGFLGLEWAITKLIGFSELSLRLVPVFCAIASVPVFPFLAQQILGKRTDATLLATALFAVSAPPIRYAAEVKPYASDLLASLLLLTLAVAWWLAPSRVRWPLALTAVVPAVVSMSLPSVFVIGAIGIVGLCDLLARRRIAFAFSYAGFLATAGLAVAVLFALGQYQTSSADRAYFLEFWASAFPPSWREPAALLRWLLRTHTGPLFAYPHGAGGPAWLTVLAFGAFIVGALVWCRRDPRTAGLLVLPFVLSFVAAALRRYPYGMSARTAQYLVPSTLLLVAAGGAWLGAHTRPRWLAQRIIPGVAIALAVMGLWRLGHDLAHPYRAPWDQSARALAKRFWTELAKDAVLVCVKADLGIACHEGRWAYDGSDQYLCLQRIYSERHRHGLPPDWTAISPTRPLRCVLINRMPGELPDFRDWIESHCASYKLRWIRTYPGPAGSDVEPVVNYIVCEFVPTAAPLAVSLGRQENTVPQGTARK